MGVTASRGHLNSPELDAPAEINPIGEYPRHDYDEQSCQWVRVDGAGGQ